MNCPKCKEILKVADTIKGHRKIGEHYFCPNMNCDHEEDKPYRNEVPRRYVR